MTFDRRVGQTFKMAAILPSKRINYHLGLNGVIILRIIRVMDDLTVAFQIYQFVPRMFVTLKIVAVPEVQVQTEVAPVQ